LFVTDLTTTKIALPTGVTLNVQTGGARGGEAIVLLHGFPESHRTWRAVAPTLANDFFVVAPDQRGFGASDKPEGVEQYRTERIVEDLIALADALEIDRFTLVGHDWGGAVAWLAALRHPDRIKRLAIVNAPHPLVFQKSLIEDEAQRAASQYISAFRNPAMEAGIAAMGFETFYEKTFGSHADLGLVPAEEKAAYLADWSAPGALTAMLNWYRASEIVVPGPGEEAEAPAWTRQPFPTLQVPTLVVWGLKDKALLPVQLAALGDVVADLRTMATAEAGHFIPWEYPEFVASAIHDFIRETPDA
jgi:pimeloyl-ACP methyl ester carboxylesterase